MQHGRPWTDDEDRVLIALVDACVPKEKIATATGRSISAVSCRRTLLGRRFGYAIKPHAKGSIIKPQIQVKTQKRRSCLKCQRSFMSAWIGHRVCHECKHDETLPGSWAESWRVVV